MNRKPSAENNSEFAHSLQHMLRKLKQGELPPESWERGLSPLEDSAAQRRIARLIAEIAERPKSGEDAAAGRPRQRR